MITLYFDSALSMLLSKATKSVDEKERARNRAAWRRVHGLNRINHHQAAREAAEADRAEAARDAEDLQEARLPAVVPPPVVVMPARRQFSRQEIQYLAQDSQESESDEDSPAAGQVQRALQGDPEALAHNPFDPSMGQREMEGNASSDDSSS